MTVGLDKATMSRRPKSHHGSLRDSPRAASVSLAGSAIALQSVTAIRIRSLLASRFLAGFVVADQHLGNSVTSQGE